MIDVHRLSADEWSRLRAIRLRALTDAPDAFATTFGETAARPVEAWRQQLLDLPTFIAIDDSADVGMVRCARDETNTETAWLISMWVDPEVRRRGVGGVLVDAVIDWARHSGMKRVLLDVGDHNAPAISLYMSKGFRSTGVQSCMPPPREHIREHQMALQLR